ncbi:TonB-dependent receptor [Maribacter sp. 2307ULW6-5]|uniref:TonB-dependent receptor n=1 Tax=Maribacter sp. 2307ULW6-5 TaxID=3386275 RepID=UPI0039BD7C2A
MRLYIALFFSAFCLAAHSQDCDGILLGQVMDFHDNTPLSKATIAITGKNRTTQTDADGKFRFKNLCDGVLELEVSHPECKTEFIVVEMEGDTFKTLFLEHHMEALDEVKVHGASHVHKTNSSQEEALETATLERFSGASLGDALKHLTGVSSLNTGANIVKPIIQGLRGSRILMLNNNVRMQDMEWGDEHAPNIDVNANSKVSVIKGAAALEYGGDAIGGVIVMAPAPIVNKDTLFGSTQLNAQTNGRGGGITSSLTKAFDGGLYIKAHGSLKNLGVMDAPNYVLSNTGVREQAVSLNVGKRTFVQGWEAYYSYFKADIGILRASHIGNVDDLINSINSKQPNRIDPFTYAINAPNQTVAHHLGKASYYRRFKGLGKWDLQYDFQQNNRLEFDIRVGDDADKASLDLRLNTHTLASNFKFDAQEVLDLKVGLMGRYQNNFANPDTGVRRLIPDYDKYDLGAYGVATFNLNGTLALDAGLRYDFTRLDAKKFYRTSRWEERNYDEDFSDIVLEDLGTQLLTNPVFDYHNVSVTVGMNQELNQNHRLRFNYSFGNRPPNPSELFSDGLHHSAARIELGDLRLQSESAHKLGISLERSGEKWGYTLAPYLNAIDNFMLLEPTGTEFTIRGAFPVWSYRQTNALLVGIDASLYSQWTDQWRTDHKFAWIHGNDMETGVPLINMPAGQLENSVSFTQKDWHNLQVSVWSQYVMEQSRFPENINVFSPSLQQEVQLDINTPPPAYHLLSLDARMQFGLRQPNDISVGLGVTNLLDTVYRDYLNRQRFFVDDLGRNISLRIIFNY